MPRNETKLTAEGTPSKQFFVSMITKDIALEDSILDLLDNAIDGAHREAGVDKPLKSFRAELTLNEREFIIEDNCGGIPLEVARNYAFHFGRPDDSESQIVKHGIGLYGIGMKRAIFKLGNEIAVKSYVSVKNGFVVSFKVNEWADKPDNDWDFPLSRLESRGHVGTRIHVKALNEGVGEAFGSLSFRNRLERIIQRDYVRFLQRGFVVKINNRSVSARPLHVLGNKAINPARKRFTVAVGSKKVSVDIVAGMMQAPPDAAEDTVNAKLPADDWGWYVLCNDRVVLAADQSIRTGWGTEGVPAWHAQYNGFVGWTSIRASDPALLPWSTTKREMDLTSPVYRDALATMREFAKQFTQYTNQRKRRPDVAKAAERGLSRIQLDQVRSNHAFTYPKAGRAPKDWQTIRYQVALTEFQAAIDALGEGDIEPADLGRRTFDYFLEAEGEE
jgi:hypothetical protein